MRIIPTIIPIVQMFDLTYSNTFIRIFRIVTITIVVSIEYENS
jgi:hypothetical protein